MRGRGRPVGRVGKLNTKARVVRPARSAVENTKVEVHAGRSAADKANGDVCTGTGTLLLPQREFRWRRRQGMRYRWMNGGNRREWHAKESGKEKRVDVSEC